MYLFVYENRVFKDTVITLLLTGIENPNSFYTRKNVKDML